MTEEFTITAFSENVVGLLNQITTVFTRRQINIESLTTSSSAIKGVHKFTIVVNTTQDQVQKLVGQIEKRIDVLKAYYFRRDEIVFQELALYKVPTKALLRSNEVEQMVRKHGARVLELTVDYAVIQKTGYKEETQELFKLLKPYGVTQFTRSGRVAVNRLTLEPLSSWLKSLEDNE
jgi:acetolactate synthase-1/3 small subunit